MTVLSTIALVLALVPAVLLVINLCAFRRPGPGRIDSALAVSVVIPARNEASNIGQALRAVLANGPLELIVVDDQSEDETPLLVQKLAATDPRVRLVNAPPLPAGWCGKQHACQVGAGHARGEFILFVDADVRLQPDAVAALRERIGSAALLSGFPRQATGTWLERLLIPLIHFVLLGFLPIPFLRRSRHPAFAAGCGQLMLVRRAAYRTVGGHTAIRSSLMDGITLPRAFRKKGFATELCDATTLATCRMYQSAQEVWSGLAKNAGEGLGSPARIVPMTLILLGGQVLPFVLLVVAPKPIAVAGCCLALLTRLIAMVRFRQSIFGAVLHPVGVLLLVAIQWYALIRRVIGRSANWRGRAYPVGPAWQSRALASYERISHGTD
jgi:Glycosyl transferase family 2